MSKGRVHFQVGSFCGLDWKNFREKIIDFKPLCNVNIFFHVSIDKDCHDILKSTFESDDVDIYALSEDKEEGVTMQEMVDKINSLPYAEAYDEIYAMQPKLDLNTYIALRVMLSMRYYRHSEAIRLLDEHYINLNSDLKKLLADLYSSEVDGATRSIQILSEIHDESSNTRGLYESIARVVSENELPDGRILIDICLRRDPENLKVIEYVASFYNKIGQYASAEELRLKLFKATGDLSQLLLAEVLSILKDDKIDGHKAEERIAAFAEKHKDNILIWDECYYRLGLLWMQKYKSHYKAFQSFSRVSSSLDNEFAPHVARLKLEALATLVAQRKAEPIRPSKYPDLLTFLADILISSLPALTLANGGFGAWRSFIEEVQDISTWQRALAKIVPVLFSKEVTDRIQDLSASSYYRSDPQMTQEKSSIFLLRFLRSQGEPAESSDELLETIDLTIDSPEGLIGNAQSALEECFVRYQLAVIASDRGRTQFTQNQALHLWLMAKEASETSLSKKATMLGLIAWGYARLRSGDIVEGVACLLSSVQLAIECEEVGPLVEDGYRSLLFWIFNSEVFTEEQKAFLTDNLRNPWQPEYRKHVYSLLCQHKWEELYNYLSKHIDMNQLDSEWAIDFLHYVQAAFRSGHRREATELIVKHHKEFISALERRTNIRPSALSSMAQMVLMESTDIPDGKFELARLLLDQAVYDMEVHRSQFFHREERAVWLDKNRPTYADHAVVSVACALMHQSVPTESLLSIFNRVTTRSILENRQELEGPSPEMVDLHKKYQELLESFTRASASAVNPQDMDREGLEHLKELQEILIKEHPFYRPLPLLGDISEDQLCKSIGVDEILYQLVAGKMWSARMIATRDGIDFDIVPVARDTISKHANRISEYMMSIPQYHTDLHKDVLNSIVLLSDALFFPLVQAVIERKPKRVFICRDVALDMFSSSLIRINDNWLFEQVPSIQNIISPIELIHREAMIDDPPRNVRMFLFGSNTDTVISKISAWQRQPDISRIVTLDKLDIKDPERETQRLSNMMPYFAFIAGHGVHDTSMLGGAVFIKDTKQMISARDLSPILKTCECAIVLSCSSGTPIASQPESGEGIWAGMIGMGAKGVVLCAWDVDAEATLGIMEYMLRRDQADFSASLCEVKRGMIRNGRYSNPYFWAGIEYWGALHDTRTQAIAGER